MTTALENVQTNIRTFCMDKSYFFKASKLENASSLAQQILRILSESSSDVRRTMTQRITRIFHDPNAQGENVQFLKEAIVRFSSLPKWKSALLSSNFKPFINIHFHFQNYSNNLCVPIRYEERCAVFSNDEMSAIFGSTFATNKPQRLNDKGDHLLDAAYGAVCYNSSGHFNGYALALGDGAGGHFGDLQQDQKIAKAAHCATKAIVRYFATYQEGDLLIRELYSVIETLRQDVQSKAPGEGTTLVCCRLFPVLHGYRMIAFNVGDNMLCSWDPNKRKFDTLLPSHVTEVGTAIFPHAYRSHEVQIFDIQLPEETVLFLMSDGVHDTLPYTEVEGLYPNALKYRSRSLIGIEHLFKQFPSLVRTDMYLSTLIRESLGAAERLRQKQHAENVQIGDDLSIVGCTLRKLASL
jgi:hypothetical protein